jgi:hypothetical protein
MYASSKSEVVDVSSQTGDILDALCDFCKFPAYLHKKTSIHSLVNKTPVWFLFVETNSMHLIRNKSDASRHTLFVDYASIRHLLKYL